MKRFTHLLLLALLFSFSAQLQAKSEKSLPKKYTKVLKAMTTQFGLSGRAFHEEDKEFDN